MSCDLSRSLVHGYLDGELDAPRAVEFERHLETCGECAAALGASRALGLSLQGAGLYEPAPASLRTRIRANLPAPRRAPWGIRVTTLRWLPAAASVLLLVSALWLALPGPRGDLATGVTTAELIDAHIRSLQAGHLTDVTSTDQHTVKPWFDGKLDFAPPVKDFATEGFPLLGGRLDALNGKSVAALVYGRRKHFINVFVWPTAMADTPIHSPASQQGYQLIDWHHQGMEFHAVSDVSASDLRELAQLFLQ
jgi:anti-sigma factor RsiW